MVSTYPGHPTSVSDRMRWDRHTLTAIGGIVALLIGGALLLEDARPLLEFLAQRPEKVQSTPENAVRSKTYQ